MGYNRSILKNLVFVWLGFATQVLATLLLTPVMISKIGSDGYGFWLVLQSFTGYYGLVDMGLRAGITQSITQRMAKGDRNSLVSYFSAILPVLVRVALVILLSGVVIGFVLSRTLTLSGELAAWVVPLAVCQSVGIGLTMLSFPFSAILPSLQRYDISETIAVVLRVATTASLYLFLLVAPSLIGVALIYLFYNILDQILRIFFALRLVPELKNVRPTSNRQDVKEMFRVGGWNFVIQISHQLLHRFNAIQVAYMFSLTSLVPFNVASSMAEHGNRVVSISTRVLYPYFAYLNHQEISSSRKLFLMSMRLCIAFSLVVAFVGQLWIAPFLDVWLENVSGKQAIIQSACSYFIIFGLINVASSIRGVGGQFLLGKDELSFMAKTMVIESLIAIILSFAFALYLGPIGIASGNLIAFSVSIVCIAFPRVANLLESDLTTLYREAFTRPVFYLACCTAAVWLYRVFVPTPTTWLQLFTIGFLPTSLMCISLLPILFTRQERQSLWLKVQDSRRFVSVRFARRH